MEPDFRMAMLLQRQLDQENCNSFQADFRLALELQDNFNAELSTQNSVGLVYDNKKKATNDNRSLIDPSWEVIDPTPDIHNLFMVFNQQFFWNKLLAVCISWSKRMTSCAGICSYQGRAGLCSITLSEPLLKLRPRKDLVETLLHEMIHAYLFVTHNNRDRDGHGPEFHKHMYRINKEAGTNITVYHNFHDEVRLYLQHWWRCNGPCQNRKPYFGMVRRATNRAPGPNDSWWNEHLQSCGGTFVKVREPEKKEKNRKEGERTPKINPLGDIRNFIPAAKNKPMATKSNKDQENISNKPELNTTENTAKVANIFISRNIHGFTNINSPQKPISNKGSSNHKASNVGGTTKLKSNSNSTIVIHKNKNTSVKDICNKATNDPTTPFKGTGNQLTVMKKPHDNHDYSIVRNHWLNKFDSKTNKRHNLDIMNGHSKKQKTSKENIGKMVPNDLNDIVNCPVCQKGVKESLLNKHLDTCLVEQDQINNKNQLCFICDAEISQSDYKDHVNKCFDRNMDSNNDEDRIECEICNMNCDKKTIENHRKSCIENIFAGSSQNSFNFEETNGAVKSYDRETLIQCSICDTFVESKQLNNHKEKCLLNVFDHIEKKHNIGTLNEEVSCLVCGTKILKSELSIHLDDCMVSVFDKSNDFVEETGKSEDMPSDKKHSCDKISCESEKYNCPFCMELYSELDMSGHLDECLNSDLDNSYDKTIVIDSFSNDKL